MKSGKLYNVGQRVRGKLHCGKQVIINDRAYFLLQLAFSFPLVASRVLQKVMG